MTKLHRPSKRLKILRILACIILLPVLLFMLLIVMSKMPWNSQESRFESAQKECADEIWIVRNDSPFTHVEEISNAHTRSFESLSYPDSIMRYACSQEEAKEEQKAIHEMENEFYLPMLIVIAIALYGSPVFLGILLWWCIEELRYLDSRHKV